MNAVVTEQPQTIAAQTVESNQPMEVYSNKANFELAQRIASALSKSSLVPEAYRDNIPNCLIALEMANRVGCSPLMTMQNLYVIQGRPSWSSTFIIASINSCGRFSPLRFSLKGEGMQRTCIASAIEKATGEVLEGPEVSMASPMTKASRSKPATSSPLTSSAKSRPTRCPCATCCSACTTWSSRA